MPISYDERVEIITSGEWARLHYISREIMIKSIGRPLKKNEIVHHKDGNVSNNDLENLELVSRGEHSRLHNTGRIWTQEMRDSLRKIMLAKGSTITKEGREKCRQTGLSNGGRKLRPRTEEEKAHLSKIHTGKVVSESTKLKMSRAATIREQKKREKKKALEVSQQETEQGGGYAYKLG